MTDGRTDADGRTECGTARLRVAQYTSGLAEQAALHVVFEAWTAGVVWTHQKNRNLLCSQNDYFRSLVKARGDGKLYMANRPCKGEPLSENLQ